MAGPVLERPISVDDIWGEDTRRRVADADAVDVGPEEDAGAMTAHADDDEWYMDPEDNYVGPGKRVWTGTREVWHGELLTHVEVYEYERPDRGLWLPINPDYQDPEHIATCRACSRSIGCLSMPDSLGCMSQRYPESGEELMAWYAKHGGEKTE